MIMTKIQWGVKRACSNCGTRFYDLNRTSAPCPKCGTVFELHTATKTRKSRAAAFELPKEILALDGVGGDLDLTPDISIGMGNDLIEDTEELGEGIDDIPDVMTENGDDI